MGSCHTNAPFSLMCLYSFQQMSILRQARVSPPFQHASPVRPRSVVFTVILPRYQFSTAVRGLTLACLPHPSTTRALLTSQWIPTTVSFPITFFLSLSMPLPGTACSHPVRRTLGSKHTGQAQYLHGKLRHPHRELISPHVLCKRMRRPVFMDHRVPG